MIKETVTVPKGIRYISEWPNFSLPQHPCIINKQITGCGFTEYCLRSQDNIILCSPRRVLLENKSDQHQEQNVFYFRNDLEKIVSFDKDLNRIDKSKEKKQDEVPELLKSLKESVLNTYYSSVQLGLGCKILVTYDSFRHVKEAFQSIGAFENFHVVIDEFQSIFTDSRFKSDTEMELLHHLGGIQNLTFVSATPMIDKYLDMLPEFSSLPYYDMDWASEDQSRVIRPDLKTKYCNSIISDANTIIATYLSGNFKSYSYLDQGGNISNICSTEAVFYVNSVKNICDIIKKACLRPDQCNILCARTDENRVRLRKAFDLTKTELQEPIGRVPKEGEQHKMFTFCTRTVYLGADFYSTCARSFIFSDANIDCLAVDITLDLPQILGRQRLDCNPWKNEATLYYKISRISKSEEEFKECMKEKIEKTESLLRVYSGTRLAKDKKAYAENLQFSAKAKHYKDDYVSVNEHASSSLIPEFNKLVMISEQRAFEIQQVDYKDRFSLFSGVSRNNQLYDNDNYIKNAVNRFYGMSTLKDKLSFLCEELNTDLETYMLILEKVSPECRQYITVLGPAKCKALRYNIPDLEKELQSNLGNQEINIKDIIYNKFKVGDKFSRAELKILLAELYKESGYSKTATSKDILNYFEVKGINVKDPETGKWGKGFELLSIK